MSDLIDRQAAIDAVAESLKGTFVEYRDIAEKMISNVPSAQPEETCDTCTHWHFKNTRYEDRQLAMRMLLCGLLSKLL